MQCRELHKEVIAGIDEAVDRHAQETDKVDLATLKALKRRCNALEEQIHADKQKQLSVSVKLHANSRPICLLSRQHQDSEAFTLCRCSYCVTRRNIVYSDLQWQACFGTVWLASLGEPCQARCVGNCCCVCWCINTASPVIAWWCLAGR